MMVKWAAWLLLAGMTWPAWAAKSLSVEELDLLLANNQGKPDAHVAQQLADVELAERVSPERLAKWEKAFAGPRTREELMRLADAAAFLKTPALDTMHIVPPDNDTQERMLELAADYAKTAFARLPDFDVTRETAHLEDAPTDEQATGASWHRNPLAMVGGKGETKPLHVTGTTIATVTFRDGKETSESAGEKNSADGQAPAGGNAPVVSNARLTLEPSGEFGTLMEVVIGDATRGQVAWSHWEQTSSDPMAVLHYAVPQDRSDLKVRVAAGAKFDEVTPAYHGEIAIDPATGSILRVSLVAEMPGMYEGMQAATLIEYAPVTLGDRTCICPVHGVVFTKGPAAGAAPDAQNAAVQTEVNDVAFTHYQLPGPAASAQTNGAAAGPPAQH
jgi:hypothetical protein